MRVRKTILPIIVSTLIFATLGLTLDAFAQNLNDQLPSEIHAPDRLIIKFNPGVSGEKQNSVISGQQVTVLSDLPKMDIKIIKVPESALDSVKEALSKNQDVEFAEYDVAAPPSVVPNDPNSNAWHLLKINTFGAWDYTKGAVDPIVILDSGIDFDHPDLQSKIIFPYNGLTQLTSGVDHQNGCGHGTLVAGSAAAVTNNGIGVAGVGWDTLIIPVKITDDNASGSTKCYGWSSGVLNGVNWAVNHGARVVNLSYGFGSGSGSIDTAAQIMQDNGGWLVISAGNSGGDPGDLEDPTIINVSSTNSNDDLSYFSSFGAYVDFSAPGSSIWTTGDGGTYGTASGTSFSAPITSAVINLMFSVNPSLSASDAYTILSDTAVDLGDPGRDDKFGNGRIDAYAAVLIASNTTLPIANDDSATVDEDASVLIDLALNDSADDGLDLDSISIVSGPNNGLVQVNGDGTVNYTHDGSETSLDSFDYTIKDSVGTTSSSARVDITVNPVNDAPIANNDSDSTVKNNPINMDVLANDTDPEGNTLTIISTTQGSNGSVSTDGATVTYTPDTDFIGEDNFDYTIDDGYGVTSFATVTITVIEPSITITNPTDNSIVTGKITITAIVSGLTGMTVSFFLDGVLFDEDSTSPYQASLHTKDISVGFHEIITSVVSEELVDMVTVEKKAKGGGGSGDGGNGGGNCNPGQQKKGKC